MNSIGSIRDVDFNGDPTYNYRKIKSKAETGEFTNTCQHQGCGHIVHKRHTPFSKQLLGTCEDFTPGC